MSLKKREKNINLKNCQCEKKNSTKKNDEKI